MPIKSTNVVPIRRGALASDVVRQVAELAFDLWLANGLRGYPPEEALFTAVRRLRRRTEGSLFLVSQRISVAEKGVAALSGRRELKLYRSVKDIRWFAFGLANGWQSFPAEVGGWRKRQRVSDIVPIDMREVPIRMAFNTGIPGAPMSSGLFQIKAKRRSAPTNAATGHSDV